MTWNSGNDSTDRKLEEVITAIQNSESLTMPSICPICNEAALHLYLNSRGRSKIGGIWIWCNSCRHYYHASFIAPNWWKNLETLEVDLLEANPTFLQENADEIDQYFNCLYQALQPNRIKKE